MEKIENTLKTSGEDGNYTRKEWRRWKLHSERVKKMDTTLETSGEDVKPRRKTTLDTSGEDIKLHSKRVEKI